MLTLRLWLMAAKLARSQRSSARGSPPSGQRLLKVGDLLASKYRVERLLGEGGMGVVVEAYHELLDQRVAVKLLYHDIADSEAQSRLLLEARSAAKLQSDHVARVVDVDVGADGLPFIVMELLEGADLCQIADDRGALPRWLVVDYILQALEGLAHAHGRGIIHRDLKPSNLFLANRADGSQIIKILDFGISKSQERTPDRRVAQLTGGRSVLGSPPYMSPEQVRSPKTVDHRTDIWSLGVCMYELLTNSMPFGGDELQETFAQILERQPTSIRALVTGVPEGLEQVVMKCLSKNREERFPDVGELANALVPFGSGSWIKSAERVQATLARALMEEMSGMRQRAPASSARIPIPSSRRPDSGQPELNGTASTVGRSGALASRRWFFGTCLAVITAGVVMIGVTYVRRGTFPWSHAPTEPAASAAPATDAPPTVVDPSAVAAVTPATAGTETDPASSPMAPGTVIGASPVPALPGVAPATSGKRAAGAATARPSPAVHHKKDNTVKESAPAAVAGGAPRTGAGDGSKPTVDPAGLPPGLPQTRSGQ
jgi:serine/threonine-protein kinase